MPVTPIAEPSPPNSRWCFPAWPRWRFWCCVWGRASIVSMNCQDAAAAGARAMAIDAGGEAKARAAAQTIAGGGSTVSFAANANSVTVVVRCPVAADPTGVLPASVVGKATRYF